MRKIVLMAVVALSLSLSGVALAADGAAIYKGKCAMCHGMQGEGMPNMGPALKGNKFVFESDDAALSDVILKGVMGPAKKYANIPVPMMPVKMNGDEVKAVIAHMKTLK
jgi:mono/diheme cytochrome c family protein